MPLHQHWTVALALSLLLSSACTGDDAGDATDESLIETTGDTSTSDTSTSDTSTSDTSTSDTSTTEATDTTTDTGGVIEFAPVHQLLLDQGCTAGYCHGAGQGGLTMTDAATAYMNLVDVDATTPACGLQKRVVPGDPESSIMWLRVRPLAQDMGMACVAKMPQGSEGLPDAEAQIVFDWIAGGALP